MATDPEIEFGAAQGSDTDTIAVSGYLDGAQGLAARFQIVAQANVYYEVGYAHALGKRPILYQKKDSILHFDLAGVNVPTYVNVSDLKQKLRVRLEALLRIESPGRNAATAYLLRRMKARHGEWVSCRRILSEVWTPPEVAPALPCLPGALFLIASISHHSVAMLDPIFHTSP